MGESDGFARSQYGLKRIDVLFLTLLLRNWIPRLVHKLDVRHIATGQTMLMLNMSADMSWKEKDRRRQRNGKRQEESNNGLIQTQEPSSFTKIVLTTMT
ncbi:uncharacterized protein LOC128161553 isoform X1 [Crassostrea angulata]|uniref:uncharacterized protein LOC128161553 isoform X1 n=1 Tax=Magallana angulata TaxID=2784310 RepID=UPI0022B09DE9|nr:uncharacterized protein LOC128161553 isoform X1 [Crassostrea angulata]